MESFLATLAFLGIGLGFLMGMSCIEFIYPSIGKSNLFQNHLAEKKMKIQTKIKKKMKMKKKKTKKNVWFVLN